MQCVGNQGFLLWKTTIAWCRIFNFIANIARFLSMVDDSQPFCFIRYKLWSDFSCDFACLMIFIWENRRSVNIAFSGPLLGQLNKPDLVRKHLIRSEKNAWSKTCAFYFGFDCRKILHFSCHCLAHVARSRGLSKNRCNQLCLLPVYTSNANANANANTRWKNSRSIPPWLKLKPKWYRPPSWSAQMRVRILPT